MAFLAPQPIEDKRPDPENDVKNQSLRKFSDGLKDVAAKSGSASGYSLQDGATGLASNYVLGSGAVSSVATGLITPRQVTSVSGLRALDKVYDRTVAAQLDATAATFDGLLAGEAINLSGSQAVFADANAGVGKAVTLGSLVINQGNYVLAGNVVVAPITATSFTVPCTDRQPMSPPAGSQASFVKSQMPFWAWRPEAHRCCSTAP